MDGMEEKLNAILGNPQMMQQIMSMAQSFSQPEPVQPEPAPDFDPGMLTQVMSLAGKTGPDPQQQNLLKALEPYLTPHRIRRLEKAMRAAKLAGMASVFLGNLPAGR